MSAHNAAAEKIAMTIATPPMRGTGLVCTRGRSPPWSTPPIRGAILATSGLSTRTNAPALRKAHGIPSSTSPRMESPKDTAYIA
jgi:hypothetical protein